jgi:antitoxin YefM
VPEPSDGPNQVAGVDGRDGYLCSAYGSDPLTGRPVFVIVMSMTSTLPLAEVKAHLSELVGRVDSQHERVTVTVYGRPMAVLVSVDDLEALEETIAVLSDTATVRRLAESDAELARGEVVEAEELAAAMAARRRKRA